MTWRVGLVGIGNIGEPVCRHLLGGGYELFVYDVDPEALARLGDTRAKTTASPEALAAEADVILLSLPNSDIVEEVSSGREGFPRGYPTARPSSTRPARGRPRRGLSHRGLGGQGSTCSTPR